MVVFIEEGEESVFDGIDVDHFLTGRFSGHQEGGDAFEDLSLDEALAWARERTDRIVVRSGFDEWAIGFETESSRPWPSGGIDRPVRRRLPGEEWKDRTDADPDATWEAIVALAPPHPRRGETDERREEWDEVVAAVAGELGGAWSTWNLDGWYDAVRSAKGGGFATMHSRQYEIKLTVRAPTRERAHKAALAPVPPLPDGWSVAAYVSYVK